MTAPDAPTRRPSRVRRAAVVGGRWLVAHGLGALIGALIALGVAAAIGDLGSKPGPIAGQLEAIYKAAALEGLEAVSQRKADLTGSGVAERIVVFRPEVSYTSGPRRSDELRIYSSKAGRLHLEYSLRALRRGNLPPYEIRLLGVGRFDSSDRVEIIMTLAEQYADGRTPRPVAVLWDAATQRYEPQALLTFRPYLKPLSGYWAQRSEELIEPVNMRLASGEVIKDVWAAQEVAVARQRLAAAYPVLKGCHACRGVWQFKTSCLNFRFRKAPYADQPESQPLATTPRYRVSIRNEADMNRQLAAALHREYCE